MIRTAAALILLATAVPAWAAAKSPPACAPLPAPVAKAITGKPYAKVRQLLLVRGYFPERQQSDDERTDYLESDFCMSGGCNFVWSKNGKTYNFWAEFASSGMGKTTVNCL